MKTHCFPDKVTEHICHLADLSTRSVFVSPSETFGKALARAGIMQDDLLQWDLPDAPLHYEPDLSVASR